jgi:hypothetical protein
MSEFGRDASEARRLKGSTCEEIEFLPEEGRYRIKLALPDGATVVGKLSAEEYDEFVMAGLPILTDATLTEKETT